MSILLAAFITIILLFVWRLVSAINDGRRSTYLPPGPPTVPILGNLLIFPKKWPHYQFTIWAEKYGDIFSLKVMHQTIIVLNSPTAVKELIDRRGASTANRPASIIADMITPDNLNIGTGRFANNTWKTLRKSAMAMLHPDNVDKFKSVQRAESAQLMWDMVQNPDNFYQDICRFTTSFFLIMIYGVRAPRSATREAKVFTQVQLDFMYVMEMGKLPPVDLFPILRWIPEKLAPWKRKVLSVKNRQEGLFSELLSRVERRISQGKQNGAFMEEAYNRRAEWELTDLMLMNLGGTLLEGSDTSSGFLQGIILLFVAYPEVQTKAQDEVDRIVGSDRPPTWDDLDSMPYLHALIEEAFRFRPIGPLAIPHAMSKDEWVNGMLFPKDAALFINLWAIFHDPRYFEEPETFKPERFLVNPLGSRLDVPDDPARRENLTFGGGRRVCPGIRIGKSGLAINVANFLWAFRFTPARDPVTKGIKPPDLWAYTEGVNATPLPFKCTIEPRSAEKAGIIRKHFLEQSALFAPFEQDLSPEDQDFVRLSRSSLG